MKKRLFLRADVDKSGIQPRHQLLYPTVIDVADGKLDVARLLLERHQAPVFKQSHGCFLWLHINYEFTSHCLNLKSILGCLESFLKDTRTN